MRILLIISVLFMGCNENELNMYGCYNDDIDLNGDGNCFNEEDLIGLWESY